MNKKFKDIIIVGFTLFVIFSDAGNLIFPPYLGVLARTEYKKAMSGFLPTDPVLPILDVIVTARLGGAAENPGKRIGNNFSKVLGTVTILTTGPLFAVPRTVATTHEVFVSKVFPGTPLWVTPLIFFILTAIFVFSETGVIDKISKYLTPELVVILSAIIVKRVVDPVGVMNIATENQIFLKGFAEGYQTMDTLEAALMTGIVVDGLKGKGYLDEQERVKLVRWVGLVVLLLLTIVYGRLMHVGATASKIYTVQYTRVDILFGTVQHILGSTGKLAIGIAMSLACLMTSVGLSAIAGDFLSGITKNKLGYKPIVLTTVLISGLISLTGVGGLINAAVPILSTVCPIIMVLISLGIFNKYIRYDMTFKDAVLATFVVSLIGVLNSKFKILEGFTDITRTLPLSSVGLGWLLPAVVTGTIFRLVAYIQDRRKIA